MFQVNMAVTFFLYLSDFDVEVVGPIPAGFPSLMIPELKIWPHILMDVLPLAFVAFAIGVSLAKIMAKK